MEMKAAAYVILNVVNVLEPLMKNVLVVLILIASTVLNVWQYVLQEHMITQTMSVKLVIVNVQFVMEAHKPIALVVYKVIT